MKPSRCREGKVMEVYRGWGWGEVRGREREKVGASGLEARDESVMHFMHLFSALRVRLRVRAGDRCCPVPTFGATCNAETRPRAAEVGRLPMICLHFSEREEMRQRVWKGRDNQLH